MSKLTTRNNIAVCQIHNEPTEVLYDSVIERGIVRFRPDTYNSVRDSLSQILSDCAQKAFVAILPENSVPVELVNHLRDEASRLELTIVAGLEHNVTWLPGRSKEKDYKVGAFDNENLLVVVPPDRDKEVIYMRKNFPAIMKDHSMEEQIGRTRMPEFLIVNLTAPDSGKITLWPILCSDFLHLSSGRILHADDLIKYVCEENVDIIAVLSHTRRVDPFHHAMEQLLVAGPRAIPTNIAFANLASYGNSVCLAYSDRMELRKGAAQRAKFWKTRALKEGIVSYRLFSKWGACAREARNAREALRKSYGVAD